MYLLDQLGTDLHVDQKSLQEKIALMDRTVNQQKEDIKAELRAGSHFLHLHNLIKLEFDEAPDIILTMGDNTRYGVEVKRIIPKPEDERDEKEFNSHKDGFVRYGKSRNEFNTWASQVEKVIDHKNSKNYSTQSLSLFLISDSSHQIEKNEIINGINSFRQKMAGRINFSAVFF